MKNHAYRWIRKAMDEVSVSFPVLLKGPYSKNDKGYLEFKNGEVVRKTVGYTRSTTEEALAAVYRVRKALRN